DGDAYADGELLRKTLAQVRETRILVFDLNYAPSPGGWGARWLVEPPGAARRSPPVAADSTVLADKTLTLDATQQPVGLTYRHWHLDDKREEPIRAWDAYNGNAQPFAGAAAVHDFLLTCEVEPAAGGGGTFACRLFDGTDSVHAEIPVGPKGV